MEVFFNFFIFNLHFSFFISETLIHICINYEVLMLAPQINLNSSK